MPTCPTGLRQHSPFSMANLRAESTRLVLKSVSQNTGKTYNSAKNTFDLFASKDSLSAAMPVPVGSIYMFISYLSLKGYSAETSATYISSLSYEHKLYGFQDPTNNFIVKKKSWKVKEETIPSKIAGYLSQQLC